MDAATLDFFFNIIIIILTALGALMGFLIYQLHKRDKRYERMIKGEVAEKKYFRSIGSLAIHTARSLIRNNLCNGEVSGAVEYCEACKHTLEDLREETVLHNAKGG